MEPNSPNHTSSLTYAEHFLVQKSPKNDKHSFDINLPYLTVSEKSPSRYQLSLNPRKRDASQLDTKTEAVFQKNKKRKNTLGMENTAAMSGPIPLPMLFTFISSLDIPLDNSSIPLLVEKQKKWSRELKTKSGVTYQPSINNEDYFTLAKSLYDRFLEKHPEMKIALCLPGLRFTALMIAIKYSDDFPLWCSCFLDWFPKGHIYLERLKWMEREFLIAIDWIIEK